MLPSILSITANSTLSLLHKPHLLAFTFRPFSKSHICFSFQPSNESPIGEEARWLREEQRWLREEQRWLREEQRWNAQRQALLQEINNLNLRIQELERLNSLQGTSVSETVANIAKLVQVLKEGDLGKNVNRIADSGTSAIPFVFEAAKKEEEEEEEVVIKEVISITDKKDTVKKRTLKKGSEGNEVRAMQEALQKLGFYSGEEDMEFSSFSTGTERAVKTWQATFGAQEDGIMTTDLLERLLEVLDQELPKTKNINQLTLKRANGAPVASIVTEGVTEVDESRHRVFLLGENRWEEPSRLSGGSKSTSGKASTMCPSCRGEGRLLCMECDGTGEPNIEEQFLEWVDEGLKCPYCEGLGHTVCDVCGG